MMATQALAKMETTSQNGATCEESSQDFDIASEDKMTTEIDHDEAENEQINRPGHILLHRHIYAICGPGTPPGGELKGQGPGRVIETANCRYWQWPLYNDFKEIRKDVKESWPPAFVNLQDWHILQICRADIAGRQCNSLWPADFKVKGIVHARRKPKGRAGKVMYAGKFHYAVVCDNYQLSGDEASQVVIQLPPNADAPANQPRTSIGTGQLCEVQEEFSPQLDELQYGMFTSRLREPTLHRRPLNNSGDWGPENRTGRAPQIKDNKKVAIKKSKKNPVKEESAKVDPKEKKKSITIRGQKEQSQPNMSKSLTYETIASH